MWCTDEAPTRCAPRDGFGSPVSSLRQRLYGRPDAESRLGLAAELDGGLANSPRTSSSTRGLQTAGLLIEEEYDVLDVGFGAGAGATATCYLRSSGE